MDGTDPTLPRLLFPVAQRALQKTPVLVITGARQVGKSTLAQQLGGGRTYLSLDDIDTLERAQREPDSLLDTGKPVTLDEVQRVPSLLLAVKRAVDSRRRAGRFVLTGSANLHLMRTVSETLAGRALYLTLTPMTRREVLGLGTAGAWNALFESKDVDWPDLLAASRAPREDWRQLALRGGYPTPAHELDSPEARRSWFAGYTQTYLERDLRELSSISSLVDFRRLMRAASLRVGNMISQTALGRDVGLPQPTVRRHLNLMEVSYLLTSLPTYAVNKTKRIIKAPKLYWNDPGLALFLAGETEPRGAHLENLVLADLLAWQGAALDQTDVMYWRTTTGEEVDFVIERGGELLPIEVKATRRPRLEDTRSLQLFRQEYRQKTRAALLLHDGDQTTWLADGVLAAPWWRVV